MTQRDCNSWNAKFSGKVAGCLSKSKGYIEIIINNKIYYAHRLAWLYVTGAFPKKEIDHINGIRNDNRVDNLRAATHEDNQKNQKLRKDNSTGYQGVIFNKKEEKYKVQINNKGERIYGSSHENYKDAVDERKRLEKKYGYHPNHGRAA